MSLSKIVFAVRAKVGLSRAEALDHLANRHAPLVANTPTVRAKMRTYVQNRAIDAPGVPEQTSDRDWIVEGWRDMTVHLPEPPVAADAIALREDEARFPDRATLLALGVQQTSFATGETPQGPVKVFCYFRKAAGLGEDWSRQWLDSAARLAQVPAFAQLCTAIECNLAMPGEGQGPRQDSGPAAPLVPLYDGIEVWRFGQIADAEALFASENLENTLKEHFAVMAPDSFFRFVGMEHIIYDDANVMPPG